jgi:hypothetical protein
MIYIYFFLERLVGCISEVQCGLRQTDGQHRWQMAAVLIVTNNA